MIEFPVVKPMDDLIARKCFATLWVDYEREEEDEYGNPPFVDCHIEVDGWYKGYIIADNREDAIEKFYRHEWQQAK